MKIEYLGWSTFRFVTQNGTKIVADPFLVGKPSGGIPPSVATIKELSDTDVVMVTHASEDHYAQAPELMKTTDAILFCGKDVGMKVRKAGIAPERLWPMAPGVRRRFRDIQITALEACHHSISDFEGHWLTGVPLCFIVDFGADGKLFFSGDNALGMHYRFFGEFYQPDLAILGIGGTNYGGQVNIELPPDEAAVAAQWLNVKAVIPMHYFGTEAQEFQQELDKRAPGVELAIMKPGEQLQFNRADGLIR